MQVMLITTIFIQSNAIYGVQGTTDSSFGAIEGCHPWKALSHSGFTSGIAKHAKVDLIWVAGRSPALVPQNFEMTTLHYLAIVPRHLLPLA
jgi:hypothetical protein